MTYSAPAQLRKLRPLATLAMIMLIGAACSNAPARTGAATDTGGSGGGSNTATNLGKAVQFAKCMRDNGVRDFPDPGASGQFTIDEVANGSSLDTNSAAFKQAIGACKDLEPPGFMGHTRTAQQQQVALKFAQCIRNEGVTDFPDPTPDGPLVDTNRIPSSGTSSGMSILNAAMRKCGSLYSGELGLQRQ